MNPVSVIEGLSALGAVGAIVFAAGRFAENVKANTTATDKLSTVMDDHLRRSAAIVEDHKEQLHGLDKRVTVLEEKERKLCTGIGCLSIGL